MMAVTIRPRHDADDLRRLAELGLTALHWRRSLAQPRPVALGNVLLVHDGAATGPLLSDLLRAISLTGMTPQLSSNAQSTPAMPSDRVIRLGDAGSAGKSPVNNASMLTIPGVAELRGNASAKRETWLKLRTLLQQ